MSNISEFPKKEEVFYDYCLKDETPASEFQLHYGVDLKLMPSYHVEQIKKASDEEHMNDLYFTSVLFNIHDVKHRNGKITLFLEHHYEKYMGPKKVFLDHTLEIVTSIQKERRIKDGNKPMVITTIPAFEHRKKIVLDWIEEKKGFLKMKQPVLEKSKKIRENKQKKDWANATALFMKLLFDTKKDNFLTCDKGDIAEAFSILSGYKEGSLNNPFGKLNTGNFTSTDFDDKDISNLKKAVKAMSDNLNLFIKSIQDKK